jgi:hypothetical protein
VTGKEARVGDHQPAHDVRVIACPTQADQTARVVNCQHDPVEPDPATEAVEDLDKVFVCPRRVRRRVPEPGEIQRERPAAR